jgi:NAD(P)-dependent dehydrogenase (short-subunit alcohol dehydrogenase family)
LDTAPVRRRAKRRREVAERAAIVTGASSGIGLEIARLLGREGHGLTLAARRPEKLEAAADELRGEGLEVQAVAGNLGLEEDVQRVVAAHRERYGRLDVLVNNAGVGVGEPVGELTTKKVDLQLATNLRSTILFYRECRELLAAAGSEHRNALVINMASLAGKHGQPWLSVYGATKAAILNFTQAMDRELIGEGIKSTALCPGFVDTPMADFIKEQIRPEDMIRTTDIAEAVRFLLRLSPTCVVPEITFARPDEGL